MNMSLCLVRFISNDKWSVYGYCAFRTYCTEQLAVAWRFGRAVDTICMSVPCIYTFSSVESSISQLIISHIKNITVAAEIVGV